MDSLALTRPRRTCRGRHGQPNVRNPVHELLDQGSFAGPRRAGHDEQTRSIHPPALAVARRVLIEV